MFVAQGAQRHWWQIEKIFNHKSALLTPAAMTPAANLPPLSTTLVKLVANFAAGVVDSGGNLPPVWLILAAILLPVANLPLVRW
jgi:hypothetical protein